VKINSEDSYGYTNSLAYDGANIHAANGVDGYTVLPLNLNGPPREDPNLPLGVNGTHSIVGICPGSPFVLTAHFIAIPAVTAYQWLKYNRTTSVYEPIANGPTGTGSTIAGATTATLTITNADNDDAGYYRCRAANTCGSNMTASYAEARLGGYANCDNSTTHPVLNVNDLLCFINQFSSSDPFFDFYPNCDGSTVQPFMNVNDFACFMNRFTAGCP